MKRLFLIRHAKSDWGDPSLSDFDRPLNERGRKAAPMMGGRLRQRGLSVDAIVSSPANRALQTARLLAQEIGLDGESILEEAKLYLASASEIEEVLWAQNDALFSLALVGHNPGMTEFANSLAPECIDNLPTCAIVRLELDIEKWNEANRNRVRDWDFDYPKKER